MAKSSFALKGGWITFIWGLRCEKNSTNPSQTLVNTLRLSQNVKKKEKLNENILTKTLFV